VSELGIVRVGLNAHFLNGVRRRAETDHVEPHVRNAVQQEFRAGFRAARREICRSENIPRIQRARTARVLDAGSEREKDVRISANQRKVVQDLCGHRCSQRAGFRAEQRRFRSDRHGFRQVTHAQGDIDCRGLARCELNPILRELLEPLQLSLEPVQAGIQQDKPIQTAFVGDLLSGGPRRGVHRANRDPRNRSPAGVPYNTRQIALVDLAPGLGRDQVRNDQEHRENAQIDVEACERHRHSP
jgi:hypothetical protein